MEEGEWKSRTKWRRRNEMKSISIVIGSMAKLYDKSTYYTTT